MEQRIGTVFVLFERQELGEKVNTILGKHHVCILARQGLSLKERGVYIISLIVEGSSAQFAALAGQLGRLPGVQVKSLMSALPSATL